MDQTTYGIKSKKKLYLGVLIGIFLMGIVTGIYFIDSNLIEDLLPNFLPGRIFYAGGNSPKVELDIPPNKISSYFPNISFGAKITNTVDDLTNFSLYHNISGSFILNKTRFPELPNNQLNDTFNGIDMTENVLLFHFNNNSEYAENDTLFYDFSGNQNNGTARFFDGDEINESGKFGKAISFDGTNDGITVLDSVSLDSATGQNSPRAWGYWRLPGTETNVLLTDKGGFVGKHFWSEQQADGTINGGIAAGEETLTTGALTNIWHFIVFSYNGSTEKLYVDGVMVDSGEANGPADDNSDLLIGSNTGGDYAANGMMDEFFIFERELSETEIVRMYNITKEYYVNYTPVRNVASGTYKWNVLAWDNATASTWNPVNYTFTVGPTCNNVSKKCEFNSYYNLADIYITEVLLGGDYGFQIKWDIRDLCELGPTNINDAQLEVFASLKSGAIDDDVTTYGTTNQSWDESSSAGEIAAQTTVNQTAGTLSGLDLFTRINITVTDHVRYACNNGYDNLTIRVEDPDHAVSPINVVSDEILFGIGDDEPRVSTLIDFEDREELNVSKRPKLYVDFSEITDTCTYGGSGDWKVNCGDNCVITTSYSLTSNTLHLSGSGSFKTLAEIYVDRIVKPKGCLWVNYTSINLK